MRLALSLAVAFGLVSSWSTIAAAGKKPPRVLISADETRVAFGTTICPADTVDLTACQQGVDAAALADFAPVKLRSTKKRKGKVGALRLRLDREGDLEVTLGKRFITWVHVDTTLAAAGVTPDGNIVVALRDGRAVLVTDEDWLRTVTDTDSYAWRVLISADESQLAIETSADGVMNGAQTVHRICPTASVDAAACQPYAIAVPEGGSEEGALARYDAAVAAGGFRTVHLTETGDHEGKHGKLRVTLDDDGTLTVRRGKRRVASIELGEDRLTLAGLGLAPSGDLVVVIDGWRAVLVPLPR